MNDSALVTLLTDFGTRDGYAAAMKGAVLAVAPRARVLDATHDIPSHDVRAGAWALGQYWRRFPAGTIHVAVVDPGVGGERAALLVEADCRYILAPDNGLIALVAEEAEDLAVARLRPEAVSRGPVSPTFHGRDLFAPAAGLLALGNPPSVLTAPVERFVAAPWNEPEAIGKGAWRGEVIHVDRFGNAITNFRTPDIDAAGVGAAVEAGGTVLCPVRRTYSDVARGAALALIGSSGRLEIAVREGSAEKSLDLRPGATIILRS